MILLFLRLVFNFPVYRILSIGRILYMIDEVYKDKNPEELA